MELNSRAYRVKICNAIVQEISRRGRNFFHHKGRTARFELSARGRLFWVDEYKGDNVNVYNKVTGRKKFTNGGTMWALVLDMVDFIQQGKYSNHNHGYGGLYCPHWGYPEEDMQAIQKLAKEMGYLNKE
jgi:hypothetical protein